MTALEALDRLEHLAREQRHFDDTAAIRTALAKLALQEADALRWRWWREKYRRMFHISGEEFDAAAPIANAVASVARCGTCRYRSARSALEPEVRAHLFMSRARPES